MTTRSTDSVDSSWFASRPRAAREDSRVTRVTLGQENEKQRRKRGATTPRAVDAGALFLPHGRHRDRPCHPPRRQCLLTAFSSLQHRRAGQTGCRCCLCVCSTQGSFTRGVRLPSTASTEVADGPRFIPASARLSTGGAPPTVPHRLVKPVMLSSAGLLSHPRVWSFTRGRRPLWPSAASTTFHDPLHLFPAVAAARATALVAPHPPSHPDRPNQSSTRLCRGLPVAADAAPRRGGCARARRCGGWVLRRSRRRRRSDGGTHFA